MDKNARIITLKEGLGTGAYIFGGIILFFAAIFLFIEMYATGFIILAIALFLIGYRRATLINTDNPEISYKWGIFVPVIETKAESLDVVKAIVVSRHVSKVRANMRSGPTDFHVEIELPDRKVRVWEFYEHEKAWQFAGSLAEMLKVGFYQGSELTY